MANTDKTPLEDTLAFLIRKNMESLIDLVQASKAEGRSYDKVQVERIYNRFEADLRRAGYVRSPEIAAKYEAVLGFVTHI